jgi:hypothetical protein
MKKPKQNRIACLMLLGSLLFSAACQAQSLLFVSPNTREKMSDDMAWSSLESFEQRNFVAVANRLGTKLCGNPQVASTEGMDGITTENSTLISGCPGGRARYLGELLARYAHQKWILVFDPLPAGHERLLIISFSTDHPQDVPQQLRQNGFTAATITAADKLVRVYLWVKDDSQDTRINDLLKTNHGSLQQITGKATFIGNDSRAVAQKVFDRLIQKYENSHRQAFSKILGSLKLHDLGLREATQ